MSEFDALIDEPVISEAQKLGWSRAQAVDYGRKLGEDEASRRRETGADREQRIKRAMAYAAWDYDGRPASSEKQRKEFGAEGSKLTPSLERVLNVVKESKR